MSTDEQVREQKLRTDLEAAAKQYHRAAENLQAVVKIQAEAGFIQKAVLAEISARDLYMARLKAFADFILNRKDFLIREAEAPKVCAYCGAVAALDRNGLPVCLQCEEGSKG